MNSNGTAPVQIACWATIPPGANQAIQETMAAFAKACTFAYETGRQEGTASNARIHSLCYRSIRERYRLGANLAVRSIGRAALLLKADGATVESIRPDRIDYDARTLRLYRRARPDGSAEWAASIWTLSGRVRGVGLRPIEAGSSIVAQPPVRATLSFDASYGFTLVLAWGSDHD